LDLEKYAKKLMKLLNKRQLSAMKSIRQQYDGFLKEVLFELSLIYARLEREGTLTYAEINRFNDLQRFIKRVSAQSVLLGSANRDILLDLLENSYDLSYSFMSYAIEMETEIVLAGATPRMTEILAQVYDNPIYGLRLETALQRDRRMIVTGINGAIADGVRAGESYPMIAKRIQSEFDSSFKRALRIAHTETHRVRERASHESAINADRQGVKMIKIWRNMDDEKVRDTKKADHVKMEGQTKPETDFFISHLGQQALVPSMFGIAEQDINCRCYASRRVSHIEKQNPEKAIKRTFEDWKKIKGSV
jgi:hypothetical protein